MNNLIFYLSILFVFISHLTAQINETTHIQDIKAEITDNSLVLFNIAEVLMDTETSLGTQAWRKFIRTRLDSKLHDELSLFVFKNAPPKSPEFITIELIRELQCKSVTVLAFTSRGRNEWYSTTIPKIDLLTEKLLKQIGFDFSQTSLPSKLSELSILFKDYFHDGVIYATNAKDKGELLLDILEKTGYRPSKIIFVDDKVDSLQSVEKTLHDLNIPFVGFAYSRTAEDHAQFDPLLANIQLDELITHGKILTDLEAHKIKKQRNLDTKQDLLSYFEQVIEKWKKLRTSGLDVNSGKVD